MKKYSCSKLRQMYPGVGVQMLFENPTELSCIRLRNWRPWWFWHQIYAASLSRLKVKLVYRWSNIFPFRWTKKNLVSLPKLSYQSSQVYLPVLIIVVPQISWFQGYFGYLVLILYTMETMNTPFKESYLLQNRRTTIAVTAYRWRLAQRYKMNGTIVCADVDCCGMCSSSEITADLTEMLSSAFFNLCTWGSHLNQKQI